MKVFKDKNCNDLFYQDDTFIQAIREIFDRATCSDYSYGSIENLTRKTETLLELYTKLAEFMIKEESQLKFLNTISDTEWEEFESK